jgi:hypothetical protein
LVAGAALTIAGAPVAAGDPVFPTADSESASATVGDLQAQGFSVTVNYLQGHPNVPLTECRVNGINNPSSASTQNSFTELNRPGMSGDSVIPMAPQHL